MPPIASRAAPPRLRVAALVATLAALLAGCGSDTQAPSDEGTTPSAGCRDGTLTSQALYRLCFPAQWNGDLVVYAHGYVSPNDPVAIQDNLVGGQPVSAVVTSLGYAFATTSYRANGLVAPLAVEDLAELDAQVRALVRPDPRRRYVVGVSEGGLVAALAGQRHPEILDGALVMCGPTGDFHRQLDHFGDFRAVFDYFFPGVLPGTVNEVPAEAQANWASKYEPAIVAALRGDTAKAGQLITVTGAPVDAADPSTREATALGLLWYSIFAEPDAAQRLGGPLFENATRTYAGSTDDGALNAGIRRYTASPQALASIEANLQTTGQVTRPTLLLTTTGDPIVPVEQQRLYGQKVAAAGKGALLTAREVARYGHCTFTAGEVLDAFNTLVAQVTSRPQATLAPPLARGPAPSARPATFGSLAVPTTSPSARQGLRVQGE